ncbi:hypothetical protein ACQPU1_07590 [Clostridium paraputrificum]|uniref:hypothetical protein n=1 Tax=Clostridium paraputrificum TaxID=29363 RepID=UPI003D3493C8
MIMYKLYPPFLYINEESDFGSQWEAFCLKLIKLNLKTDDIERRRPPENGVDLYYEKDKIAYQCKSCLINSDVNITNVTKSLRSALSIKEELGWNKYIICSNKNYTGDQVDKIKKVYENVEVKGENYWVSLCEKFPEAVRKNFRILIDLNKPIHNYRKEIMFNPEYQKIKEKMEMNNDVYINFCCEKHNKIYKIPMSTKLSIYEFMFMLRNIMELDAIYLKTNGLAIIREKFIFNDIEYYYDPNDCRTLEEIGIKNQDIVFYIINVEIKEIRFNENELQCLYSKIDINKDEIEKGIFNSFDDKVIMINRE